MEYIKRVYDDVLEQRMKAFGAVLIVGPKGCGKTSTAARHSKTLIRFQDESRRDFLLQVASDHTSDLLKYEKPILFDEWQDAPKLWGAIRTFVDDKPSLKGSFVMTGSTSSDIKPQHTGTLRISKMEMLPMNSFEIGDSNGTVSLSRLFSGEGLEPSESAMGLEDIAFAICRGGWPSTLTIDEKTVKLDVAKDLHRQICEVDASSLDSKRRNKKLVKAILRSYSRNLCTYASYNTVHKDVQSSSSSCSEATFDDYLEALERLYIVQDVESWSPKLRRADAMRKGGKRNVVDPSIAARALMASPASLMSDFETFGFLFESLCIRDLKSYVQPLGGEVLCYHDKTGLEVDAVVLLDDGRYALVEIKSGSKDIDRASENMGKLESLIRAYNEENPRTSLGMPSFKMVMTGTSYSFRREDGVYVVPVGCLRE